MRQPPEILGEKTRLRPLAKADLGRLLEWRNAHRFSFVDATPISADQHVAWYESYVQRADDYVFIIETLEGVPIGSVSLYHLDPVAGSAEFGRLMLAEAQYAGRGYAGDACRALLRHGFTELGLSEVYLHVLETNGAAIALYASLGFARDPSRDSTVCGEGISLKLLGMSVAGT